jgi:hypothetical protein
VAHGFQTKYPAQLTAGHCTLHNAETNPPGKAQRTETAHESEAAIIQPQHLSGCTAIRPPMSAYRFYFLAGDRGSASF